MKNSAPDKKQSPAKGRKGRCLSDTNQLGKVMNFIGNFQVRAGREASQQGDACRRSKLIAFQIIYLLCSTGTRQSFD